MSNQENLEIVLNAFEKFKIAIRTGNTDKVFIHIIYLAFILISYPIKGKRNA